eukprot:TRINITY_DN6925_c0_g2_i3.p1 TRINITY_DN6925_c0_g2~~TRINITY_DN6925_c0_g2_i3.p1  ORF type:complete len:1343 (+),score=341.67 TRINITY_DN6925_c0_g2_i3:90-4118(+)
MVNVVRSRRAWAAAAVAATVAHNASTVRAQDPALGFQQRPPRRPAGTAKAEREPSPLRELGLEYFGQSRRESSEAVPVAKRPHEASPLQALGAEYFAPSEGPGPAPTPVALVLGVVPIPSPPPLAAGFARTAEQPPLQALRPAIHTEASTAQPAPQLQPVRPYAAGLQSLQSDLLPGSVGGSSLQHRQQPKGPPSAAAASSQGRMLNPAALNARPVVSEGMKSIPQSGASLPSYAEMAAGGLGGAFGRSPGMPGVGHERSAPQSGSGSSPTPFGRGYKPQVVQASQASSSQAAPLTLQLHEAVGGLGLGGHAVEGGARRRTVGVSALLGGEERRDEHRHLLRLSSELMQQGRFQEAKAALLLAAQLTRGLPAVMTHARHLRWRMGLHPLNPAQLEEWMGLRGGLPGKEPVEADWADASSSSGVLAAAAAVDEAASWVAMMVVTVLIGAVSMLLFVCLQRRSSSAAAMKASSDPLDPEKKGEKAAPRQPAEMPVSDPALFLSDDEDDSQTKRLAVGAAGAGECWVPTVWVDEDADEDDDDSSLSSRASVDLHLGEPASPELPFGGTFEHAAEQGRQRLPVPHQRLQPQQYRKQAAGVQRDREMTLQQQLALPFQQLRMYGRSLGDDEEEDTDVQVGESIWEQQLRHSRPDSLPAAAAPLRHQVEAATSVVERSASKTPASADPAEQKAARASSSAFEEARSTLSSLTPQTFVSTLLPSSPQDAALVPAEPAEQRAASPEPAASLPMVAERPELGLPAPSMLPMACLQHPSPETPCMIPVMLPTALPPMQMVQVGHRMMTLPEFCREMGVEMVHACQPILPEAVGVPPQAAAGQPLPVGQPANDALCSVSAEPQAEGASADSGEEAGSEAEAAESSSAPAVAASSSSAAAAAANASEALLLAAATPSPCSGGAPSCAIAEAKPAAPSSEGAQAALAVQVSTPATSLGRRRWEDLQSSEEDEAGKARNLVLAMSLSANIAEPVDSDQGAPEKAQGSSDSLAEKQQLHPAAQFQEWQAVPARSRRSSRARRNGNLGQPKREEGFVLARATRFRPTGCYVRLRDNGPELFLSFEHIQPKTPAVTAAIKDVVRGLGGKLAVRELQSGAATMLTRREIDERSGDLENRRQEVEAGIQKLRENVDPRKWLTGRVSTVQSTGIYVGVAEGKDAFIPTSELTPEYAGSKDSLRPDLEAGETIDFRVIRHVEQSDIFYGSMLSYEESVARRRAALQAEGFQATEDAAAAGAHGGSGGASSRQAESRPRSVARRSRSTRRVNRGVRSGDRTFVVKIVRDGQELVLGEICVPDSIPDKDLRDEATVLALRAGMMPDNNRGHKGITIGSNIITIHL